MSGETPEIELAQLQIRARNCGMFVQRHKVFDPTRGTGDLYLAPRKRFRSEKVETILSYATADEIHEALAEVEAGTFGKLTHV